MCSSFSSGASTWHIVGLSLPHIILLLGEDSPWWWVYPLSQSWCEHEHSKRVPLHPALTDWPCQWSMSSMALSCQQAKQCCLVQSSLIHVTNPGLFGVQASSLSSNISKTGLLYTGNATTFCMHEWPLSGKVKEGRDGLVFNSKRWFGVDESRSIGLVEVCGKRSTVDDGLSLANKHLQALFAQIYSGLPSPSV